MLNTRTGILLIACMMLVWTTAFAGEYHVNQDGSGDFVTIQDAIDAAIDGDVIIVHPGTYYENIRFDGKNITLRSTEPRDQLTVDSTVIDAGQNGSVVEFSGSETERCLLSGFTIVNGSVGGYGGGICGGEDPAYTHAYISRCVVTGNYAWSSGGGIYGCHGRIDNCTISGNGADFTGGGMARCDGTITDCSVSDNSARSGGGLCGCDGCIINCTVSGNVVGYSGGGLNSCTGTITNCLVCGNWAFDYGGGLYRCSGEIRNCTIGSNEASNGGGIAYCEGVISNSIVWGNEGLNGPDLWKCDAEMTYSCVRGWSGGGMGNITDDPLFVEGPLGSHYLSCSGAGQPLDSPCFDRGADLAKDLGLDLFSIRTDHSPDVGIVDLGFHRRAREPREYQVNQDGSGDCTSIQEAIDRAGHRDVIVVHPGTYNENLCIGNKNITLRSLEPENEQVVASTIIDGGRRGGVVVFGGSEDDSCLLSGFTIVNGENDYGGGIEGGDRYGPFTHAVISDCTIDGNSAEFNGGGLYCCCGGVRRCVISSNTAQSGGGLYGCNGQIEDCTISDNSAFSSSTYSLGGGLFWCDGTIVNCTISGNSAYYGGALAWCDTTIGNCTISGNSAGWAGGGLYQCGISINNTTLSGNHAEQGGGLYFCDGPVADCTISANQGCGLITCSGPITNCRICDNGSSGVCNQKGPITDCVFTGNSGGGISLCDWPITNCLIANNTAYYGGGLSDCEGTITNCTITGNTAVANGGGLHTCTAKIRNCIVWGNQAANCANTLGCDGSEMTFCCIPDWPFGGDGNITGDPLFVSGSLGDYYLHPDSPCVDAGSMLAVDAGMEGGTTRSDGGPDTGVVDMGYHYPTLFALPEVWVSTPSETYSHGDTLEVVFEAINPNSYSYSVDLYAAIMTPDGLLWTIDADGDWSTSLSPWFTSLELPAGYAFGPTTLVTIELPSEAPPISEPGTYWVAAAFAHVGTTTFIGQPSLSPLELTSDQSEL